MRAQNMAQKKIILNKSTKLIFVKFINHLTKGGKNHGAEKIWLQVLRNVRKKIKKPVHKLVGEILLTLAPVIDAKKIRRGKETFRIPSPIRWTRSRYFAIKWLFEKILDTKTKSKVVLKLTETILAALINQNEIQNKPKSWQKTIQKNSNYLRYRWF